MKKPNESKKIYNDADKLANELADRPYAGGGKKQQPDSKRKVSFDIDESQLEKLEDIALQNKRAKLALKTVSDLLRVAVDDFLKKYNNKY